VKKEIRLILNQIYWASAKLEPVLSLVFLALALALLMLMTLGVHRAAEVGLLSWDSNFHYSASLYSVYRFLHLPIPPLPIPMNEGIIWYGPLWEWALGIFSESLSVLFSSDPFYVRTLFNFSLFPLTLVGVGWGLYRLGYGRATAFLGMAMLFSSIRFGGHALLNTKDFPYACATLLIALWLTAEWHKIERSKHLLRELVSIGLIGITPFLLRPPAGQLFVVAWLLALKRIRVLKARLTTTLLLAGIPLLAAALVSILLWPALRDHGPLGLGKAIVYFLRFPWNGDVRLLGLNYPSQKLPIWYAFAWVFISNPPLTFVLILLGLALLLYRSLRPLNAKTSESPGLFKALSKKWERGHTLALLFALGWVGVLIKRPILYDEDRHLLFILAPLGVLAAIGLSRLPSLLQLVLAISLLGAGATRYQEWGIYSYVYKSELLRDRRGGAFMGDYWGVCYNQTLHEVARYLNEQPTPLRDLVIDGPFDSMKLQWDRVLKSQSTEVRAKLQETRIIENPPQTPNQYLIAVYHRNNSKLERVRQDIASGKAKLIWQTQLPPASQSEPACLLAYYFGQ
jgi:hypothetical protein